MALQGRARQSAVAEGAPGRGGLAALRWTGRSGSAGKETEQPVLDVQLPRLRSGACPRRAPGNPGQPLRRECPCSRGRAGAAVSAGSRGKSASSVSAPRRLKPLRRLCLLRTPARKAPTGSTERGSHWECTIDGESILLASGRDRITGPGPRQAGKPTGPELCSFSFWLSSLLGCVSLLRHLTSAVIEVQEPVGKGIYFSFQIISELFGKMCQYAVLPVPIRYHACLAVRNLQKVKVTSQRK
ncbi:uncharacterized protein LOC116787978 [Chiroxiphia lanceolata]|uniref:uncharacterized protein LOC116787978 n=1 Tax=Chiroxiphia lanceolata TaxID=296741 RepID=UPI0013CF19F2|nr:uncharacterized protein LOC116787978 [Chiroxiphia lanceolata]